LKLVLKTHTASNLDKAAGKPLDILFIHGTGSKSDMWAAQVSQMLELGHRCYTVDLRGHGSSPEPGEKTDLAVHIEDVLETIQDSDITFPCVFVGHSLGAIISVSMAASSPELFAMVFAAGLPARVLKPVSLAFRVFMRTGYNGIKKSGLHKNWSFRPRTLIETERHALEQIMHNFEGVDFLAKPPQVACPLHLAAGRFDPVAPCHYAVRLHQLLPKSTLKIFELAGHNFMDTHGREFNTWLMDGLGGKLAAGSTEGLTADIESEMARNSTSS